MPANNAPELPLSMRLKGRMAQMMQGVGGRLLPMQDFLVALLNLIHTLRTTHRNPLNIPAQNAAQPAQTPPLALAGGAQTAALPPGRNTESHPTIAVPAVKGVDGELVIEDDMTPEREFTRVKLERTYAMPDDVHAPAVRALEAAFADSAIGQTAANDNTFGQVGRAVAGISPAAAQGGGRGNDGNDGNADQALNAPENSSDLAKRLSEIAQLAEHSQLEAVSAMRELMKQEASRLDVSWPQIARAAEENPRLRSVLDTAIMPNVRQSASNE